MKPTIRQWYYNGPYQMEDSTLQEEIYVITKYVRISYAIIVIIYSVILLVAFVAFRDLIMVEIGLLLLWLILTYFTVHAASNPRRIAIASNGTLTQKVNSHKTVRINLLNLTRIDATFAGGSPGSVRLMLTLTDRQGEKVSLIPDYYTNSVRLLESINSAGQYSKAEYTGMTSWVRRIH